MSEPKKYFLTSEQIAKSYKEWLASGDSPDTRTISENMGNQMLIMCRHLTGHKNFVGYPQQMKDEMVSDGVLKIVKNLKNMNPDKEGSFFSYWTRCAWCAFVTYLDKYYKRVNNHRELMLKMLQDFKDDNNGAVVNQDKIRNLEELVRRYSNDGSSEIVE